MSGRNILVTFGGTGYEEYTERTIVRAPAVGVDVVRVYDDVWLRAHEFYRLNAWLWQTEERRGFGWHAWKPLIVLDTMDKAAAAGDVVLFLDGDTCPTGEHSLAPLFDLARHDGAVLFEYSGWEPQSNWCTRNCFVAMGQDEERYHRARHGCARFGLFHVGPWKPRQFLMEWLTYCVNPDANARHPRASRGPNLPGFVEHRTDQAIYTLLAHRYGYPLHPEISEPTQERQPGPQYVIQGASQANDDGKGSRFRNVETP
jgi:hypothetical protein